MKTYSQLKKELKEDGVTVGSGISGGSEVSAVVPSKKIKPKKIVTEFVGGGGAMGGGPTNIVSSGSIAGTPPDSPPVNLKKKRKKDFPNKAPSTPVLGTIKRKLP